MQWIYSLVLEIVEYIAGGLLDVFSMDLTYFESAIPVMGDILDIIIASGWALLLGNLVFQSAKSMMSGLGFEGEDPKTLFARTFVFGFMLLASRQVCEIGLGMSSTVITMLQIPSSVSVSIPGEDVFSIGASWLLVIIVGFVLMWQIVKLFFEIGERYFLVGLLTITAPWAFAMGGSKSTADIFKGWARMFASMCLMMILNVVFLKMLLSAMGTMPSDAGILPWMIFVVAIARVARKIDNVIARIGLNPALTGDGLGRSFPGMLSYMVVRTVASSITKTAGGAAKSKTPPGGTPPSSGTSSAGNRRNPFSRNHSGSGGTAQGAPNTQTTHNTSTSQQAATGAAGTPPPNAGTHAPAAASGGAGTGLGPAGPSQASASHGAAGTANVNAAANQSMSAGHQFYAGNRNATGGAGQKDAPPQRSESARRSSVTKPSGARSPVFSSGAAGKPSANAPRTGQNASPIHPPIPRTGQAGQPAAGAAGTAPQGDGKTSRPSRYSSVPPGARSAANPGAAGKTTPSNDTNSLRTQQGGANISAQNQTTISADQSGSRHEFQAGKGPGTQTKTPGAAGTGTRRSSVSSDKPPGAAGNAPKTPATPVTSASSGAAGTERHRSSTASASPAGRPPSEAPRGGRNQAPVSPGAHSFSGNNGPARRERGFKNAGNTGTTRQPPSGAAGKSAQIPDAVKKPDAGQSRQSVIGQGTARIGGLNSIPNKSKGTRGNKKNKKGDTYHE